MSCVIVLGFYRSGTSAVAGLLHHLGVFMGEKFDTPNENNKLGYWEDLEFKDLHKEMMGDLLAVQPISPATLVAYHGLVEDREKQPIWGIKDPRLCVLMSHIHEFFPTNYQMIVCWRPKDEIINSLQRSQAVEDAKRLVPLLEFYEHQMDDFLHNDCNHETIGVSFGDLKLHAHEEVARIAEFVGLPVNEQALAFIQ